MALHGEILHDGQTVCAEHVLHGDLVHADGRGEHARAHVGQPRQLEQSLDGAVLAPRAVEHDPDHVQPLAQSRRQALGRLHALECCRGADVTRADGQGLLDRSFTSSFAERFARSLLGERAQRIAPHEPAPFAGDADLHRLEALAVDGGHDGCRAREGHLVLA